MSPAQPSRSATLPPCSPIARQRRLDDIRRQRTVPAQQPVQQRQFGQAVLVVRQPFHDADRLVQRLPVGRRQPPLVALGQHGVPRQQRGQPDQAGAPAEVACASSSSARHGDAPDEPTQRAEQEAVLTHRSPPPRPPAIISPGDNESVTNAGRVRATGRTG
jgi:hypothetical protein